MSRNLWMWPRCVRAIAPWKVASLVSAFYAAFHNKEYSSQDNQNLFTQIAKDQGLIRTGHVRDSHSGGPRTFYSLLEALGLVFRLENQIHLTQAGELLIDPDVEPGDILRRLLLRFQYPCIYSQGRGVQIASTIKIKPFVFLLKLMNDPDLGYITDKEICIPVIYAKIVQDYKKCKTFVLQLRQGIELNALIDNPESLWTIRARGSIEERLPDIKDIANTMRNCLSSTGLCYRDDTIEGTAAYRLNEEYRSLIEEALERESDFIEVEGEESFQRKFGLIRGRKDTRLLQKSEKADPEGDKILALWLAETGQRLVSELSEEFIQRLSRGYGISRTKVISTLTPHLASASSRFESTLLEKACGGVATAKEFEKLVNTLLEKMLGMRVDDTGSKKPPKRRRGGGYADGIIFNEIANSCGLINCKATSAYNFAHTDRLNLIHNYVPHYQELTGSTFTLLFFLYVAGGFTGRISQTLEALKVEAGIPVSAIDARTLLKFASTKTSQQIWTAFCNGGVIEE